jgi:5-formyltetrahydrofolate cyclo-ligase
MDDVAARKRELRGRMREVRAAIGPEQRAELSRRIEDALFALPEVRAARTVLLFSSFGTEVPTAAMVDRLLDEGRRVLLPFLDEQGDMEAAELRPGESPVPSGYGPNEPPRRAAVDPREIDVVVTPGLAFDRRGARLGLGGGHYDRFLPRLRQEAKRIGLAFAVQVLDELPVEPADQRVEVVVTEEGSARAFSDRPQTPKDMP